MALVNCVLTNGYVQCKSIYINVSNDATKAEIIEDYLECWQWPEAHGVRGAKWEVSFNEDDYYSDGGYYAEQKRLKEEAKAERAKKRAEAKERKLAKAAS